MDSFLRLCRGASVEQQESSFVKIWSPGSDYEMFRLQQRICPEIDGFKYGLGFAYAFNSKLSIQTEYSKINYDTLSTNTGNLQGYPGSIFQQKYDLDSEDLKIGLNYRF